MGVWESSGHTSERNALNFALIFAVALPAVLFTSSMSASCECQTSAINFAFTARAQCTVAAGISSPNAEFLCQAASLHPLALLSVIFLLNVSVLFWLVSLVQGSTWLIDPYWTLCPPLCVAFLAVHPQIAPVAALTHPRVFNALLLLVLWSVRLTHSYLRREEFCFGAREDWRFAEMRNEWGSLWWLVSLPLAYLSQQVLLVGLVVPYYVVLLSAEPWSFGDTGALLCCAAGLTIAYAADSELYEFMSHNALRKEKGEEQLPLLNTGMWYLCRHPNYAGEQMFWWGVAAFAAFLGWPWTAVGTVLNSLVLLRVTHMTEARMLAKPERKHVYKAYQTSTPMWLPTGKLFLVGSD
eukprot:a685827_81.p1 GENE.a685827_81~~a685827_81.p1  ORF type:complete len:363 (+),score=130.97 a685827_81:31-1089(+)